MPSVSRAERLLGVCVCVCVRCEGVLKEFLRELPEPLCSDSLYQMLMDALNVQISGDADGNARLMLGILDCLPAVNQVCTGVFRTTRPTSLQWAICLLGSYRESVVAG